MFQPVSNQADFPALERDVLAFWQRTKAFDRLRQLRATSDKQFSFIDGPITANNPMGVHHAWGRTYKDLWQRYKAMQGHNQRWQNGFDCQGLWVEVNVEKDLGFTNKRDIEAMGIDAFVALCKQRVLHYAAQQTDQTIRLGNWMDWNDTDELRMLAQKIVEDPSQHITLERDGKQVHGTVEQLVGELGLPELGGSYFTFSTENNYQIWAFLKKCHQNGWIYRGADVIPWCPRCATGISQHEMDTEGYKDRIDPAIVVRMRLKQWHVEDAAWREDGHAKFQSTPNRYILAWTTTPWTLPSNTMCAVGPKIEYSIVQQTHSDGEQAVYFLGSQTLGLLKGEYAVLGTILGERMSGWTYEGLFDDLPAWHDAEARWRDKHGFDDDRHFEHPIILWDEVGVAEGTGVVHNAPGAGPEDFKLGLQHSTPMVEVLDESGNYISGFGPLTGKYGHDVPDLVEKLLREKGLLYRRDKYTHRYAHCWRCSTPLLYRKVDEWYISMTDLRHDMMRVSQQINWIPPFGKERELDWLRNMHDWMISKKRYWGLALPIWEYPDGTFEVIGSREELKARAVEGWHEFDGHTPHRPHIDKVKIKHPITGQIGTRVPDVGNPWLDAGIVSFSTLRYGEDKDYWQKWFPADFITESFPGQFRNWFYSLIAMSTVLEEHMPTQTILGFATLMDEKGKPMHKSSGNSIEFNEAADKAGADVMRWLYSRQKYDDNLLFGFNTLSEVRRSVVIPLWNVYSFFVTYANADGWEPTLEHSTNQTFERSNLDRWILARLAETTNTVVASLDAYEARPAALAVEKFVDDLSNWYVRRSRDRFWGSEMTADKQAAYASLYEVLTTLCKLLAPFMPFLTETMWQNLTNQLRIENKELRKAEGSLSQFSILNSQFSVHHQPYPTPRSLTAEEQALLRETELARTVVNLGHSTRAQSKVKVRQPLARAMIVANAEAREAVQSQYAIITDELNVKGIEFVEREAELVSYRALPDLKKLGKKLGADLPTVKVGLSELDPMQVAALVKSGQPVRVNGVTLASDEVIIQAVPREGLIVAGENGIVVGLDTTMTEALVYEGLAREVVRRINDLRKTSGLSISDRIVTAYEASPKLAEAIATNADYIKGETLTMELREGALAGDTVTDTFDSETLRITIRKS
jgi:isoleucyl-tRNA synthetase